MPALVKLAGEQGLLMIDMPEEYGGADLGLIVSALVASEMRQASFAVAHGAHTTIGTLPIVFYGTDEQKRKYLPRLATGEMIGAYALTEPGVGSDAMAIARARTLSEDGKHYILNGAKQWIIERRLRRRDGGLRQGGRHQAHRLHRRDGLARRLDRRGGEEDGHQRLLHAHGLLRQRQVPVENVLGEIGKGYKIAFNILNIGRLKLGLGAAGGAQRALTLAAQYANERKAFGRPLAGFGMIKKKLAYMAADVYAAESLGSARSACRGGARWRRATTSRRSSRPSRSTPSSAPSPRSTAREALGRCVDEGVQVFGGYGFMEEYPDLARLSRRAHQPHLRGHERGQPPASPPARSSAARWQDEIDADGGLPGDRGSRCQRQGAGLRRPTRRPPRCARASTWSSGQARRASTR